MMLPPAVAAPAPADRAAHPAAVHSPQHLQQQPPPPAAAPRYLHPTATFSRLASSPAAASAHMQGAQGGLGQGQSPRGERSPRQRQKKTFHVDPQGMARLAAEREREAMAAAAAQAQAVQAASPYAPLLAAAASSQSLSASPSMSSLSYSQLRAVLSSDLSPRAAVLASGPQGASRYKVRVYNGESLRAFDVQPPEGIRSLLALNASSNGSVSSREHAQEERRLRVQLEKLAAAEASHSLLPLPSHAPHTQSHRSLHPPSLTARAAAPAAHAHAHVSPYKPRSPISEPEFRRRLDLALNESLHLQYKRQLQRHAESEMEHLFGLTDAPPVPKPLPPPPAAMTAAMAATMQRTLLSSPSSSSSLMYSPSQSQPPSHSASTYALRTPTRSAVQSTASLHGLLPASNGHSGASSASAIPSKNGSFAALPGLHAQHSQRSVNGFAPSSPSHAHAHTSSPAVGANAAVPPSALPPREQDAASSAVVVLTVPQEEPWEAQQQRQIREQQAKAEKQLRRQQQRQQQLQQSSQPSPAAAVAAAPAAQPHTQQSSVRSTNDPPLASLPIITVQPPEPIPSAVVSAVAGPAASLPADAQQQPQRQPEMKDERAASDGSSSSSNGRPQHTATILTVHSTPPLRPQQNQPHPAFATSASSYEDEVVAAHVSAADQHTSPVPPRPTSSTGPSSSSASRSRNGSLTGGLASGGAGVNGVGPAPAPVPVPHGSPQSQSRSQSRSHARIGGGAGGGYSPSGSPLLMSSEQSTPSRVPSLYSLDPALPVVAPHSNGMHQSSSSQSTFAQVSALIDDALDTAKASVARTHTYHANGPVARTASFKHPLTLHPAAVDGRPTGAASSSSAALTPLDRSPTAAVIEHNGSGGGPQHHHPRSKSSMHLHLRRPSTSLASSLLDDAIADHLSLSIADRLQSNRLASDPELRSLSARAQGRGSQLHAKKLLNGGGLGLGSPFAPSPPPETEMAHWALHVHELMIEEKKRAEAEQKERKRQEEELLAQRKAEEAAKALAEKQAEKVKAMQATPQGYVRRV